MPWMAVGVYLPPDARSCVRAGFSAAFTVFVDFFGALLRAGFFAAARFFMPRTLQPGACLGQRASRRNGAPVSRVRIHSLRRPAPSRR